MFLINGVVQDTLAANDRATQFGDGCLNSSIDSSWGHIAGHKKIKTIKTIKNHCVKYKHDSCRGHHINVAHH